MKFFEELATMADETLGFGIAITVKKDVVVVTVTPKTSRDWTPFQMRGKPDELDAAFTDKIKQLQAGVAVIKESADYADDVKKEVATTVPPKTAAPAKKKEAPKTKSVSASTLAGTQKDTTTIPPEEETQDDEEQQPEETVTPEPEAETGELSLFS